MPGTSDGSRSLNHLLHGLRLHLGLRLGLDLGDGRRHGVRDRLLGDLEEVGGRDLHLIVNGRTARR